MSRRDVHTNSKRGHRIKFMRANKPGGAYPGVSLLTLLETYAGGPCRKFKVKLNKRCKQFDGINTYLPWRGSRSDSIKRWKYLDRWHLLYLGEVLRPGEGSLPSRLWRGWTSGTGSKKGKACAKFTFRKWNAIAITIFPKHTDFSMI